jgi:hypothetical protein
MYREDFNKEATVILVIKRRRHQFFLMRSLKQLEIDNLMSIFNRGSIIVLVMKRGRYQRNTLWKERICT